MVGWQATTITDFDAPRTLTKVFQNWGPGTLPLTISELRSERSVCLHPPELMIDFGLSKRHIMTLIAEVEREGAGETPPPQPAPTPPLQRVLTNYPAVRVKEDKKGKRVMFIVSTRPRNPARHTSRQHAPNKRLVDPRLVDEVTNHPPVFRVELTYVMQ